MATMSVVVMVIGLAALASLTIAEEGTATFYNYYVPSACYGSTDHGVMIAAASDPVWNNGAACGTSYTVRCTGATNAVPHPCKDGSSVQVTIVDHCPDCGGTLDLSVEAFAAIANPVAGIIKIDYTQA